MPLLSHSHDSEVIVQPSAQDSSIVLLLQLQLLFLFLMLLGPKMYVGLVCVWVSSLITYAVEIFSAQHFMHVVPIYKSFLFVCLHFFVFNVAASTWRIHNVLSHTHMSV